MELALGLELAFGSEVTPNSFRNSLKKSGHSAPSRMAPQALRSAEVSSAESSGMLDEVVSGVKRSIRVASVTMARPSEIFEDLTEKRIDSS